MSWWTWINIVAAVAGLIYWLRGANVGLCFHDLYPTPSHKYTGGLRCRKCGRPLYPERLKTRKLYRALGRIHKETEQ